MSKEDSFFFLLWEHYHFRFWLICAFWPDRLHASYIVGPVIIFYSSCPRQNKETWSQVPLARRDSVEWVREKTQCEMDGMTKRVLWIPWCRTWGSLSMWLSLGSLIKQLWVSSLQPELDTLYSPFHLPDARFLLFLTVFPWKGNLHLDWGHNI